MPVTGLIAAHLPVDGERSCLDFADGTKHQDCPVEHAKAAFHLDGKIDVARGMDQIDHGIAHWRLWPHGDGYTAFLFQFHVVHGCPAAVAVDFLHAVDSAGVEQDRSESVVLPESIWAEMPILRSFAMSMAIDTCGRAITAVLP